jgi:hypothetical protein
MFSNWAAFQQALQRTVQEAVHKIAGDNYVDDVFDPRDSVKGR